MIQFIKDNCLLIASLAIILFIIATVEIILFVLWKKKSKYETQMLTFRDKALIRQVNAHFIFNFLNSLQSHLISDNKIDAIKNVGKFSNMLRRFLENSLYSQITIQNEIDALNLYMEIEQFRFKNIFDFEINIDKAINTFHYKMPSFLLQPFVENALYHGILFLKKENNRRGKITINFELLQNNIKIIIEDNGVGRKKTQDMKQYSEKKSFGNQFIEKRMETLSKFYKKRFSVRFIDKTDSLTKLPTGTKVEIIIPQIF